MTTTRTAPSIVSLAILLQACFIDATSLDTHADPEGAGRSALRANLAYRGVTLAGAEFGSDEWGVEPLPGQHSVDYIYPAAAFVAGYGSPRYFLASGMNTFRLPFRWERLQPSLGQPLDPAELTRLHTTVQELVGHGAKVVLDLHNFARHAGALLGSPGLSDAQFADVWSRIASEFKDEPDVLFGLMNEPHGFARDRQAPGEPPRGRLATEAWAAAANAAIAAIRAAGASQLILVAGNGYSGAHSWSDDWYGTPNADVMLGIADSQDNFAFEVHQYLDSSSSGAGVECTAASAGHDRMLAFTGWLEANDRTAVLGEFGGPRTLMCLEAIEGLLAHVDAHADRYLGWLGWAAGPWWDEGKGYPLSLEPKDTLDAPQMTVLRRHLKPPSCAAVRYDARAMSHSAGGIEPDGWNLWSNGALFTSHAFGAQSTTVTVSARGTPAAGGWPHMEVSVDGEVVGRTTVATTELFPHSFTFSATAGSHQLRIEFDNDAVSDGEDRNLIVGHALIECF